LLRGISLKPPISSNDRGASSCTVFSAGNSSATPPLSVSCVEKSLIEAMLLECDRMPWYFETRSSINRICRSVSASAGVV